MSLKNRPNEAGGPWRCWIALGLFAFAALFLSACAEKTQAASYVAYNYNARSIVSVIVNNDGGILNVPAYGGGGGEMCCVILPSRWRPGLKVAVKWQEDGDWLLDEHGKEVMREGRRVYVPRPYKEKTAEIVEYQGGEGPELGQVHILFLPNDEVKVLVSRYGPGDPRSRYPYPKAPEAH